MRAAQAGARAAAGGPPPTPWNLPRPRLDHGALQMGARLWGRTHFAVVSLGPAVPVGSGDSRTEAMDGLGGQSGAVLGEGLESVGHLKPLGLAEADLVPQSHFR